MKIKTQDKLNTFLGIFIYSLYDFSLHSSLITLVCFSLSFLSLPSPLPWSASRQKADESWSYPDRTLADPREGSGRLRKEKKNPSPFPYTGSAQRFWGPQVKIKF